jgi:hypothetical protein
MKKQIRMIVLSLALGLSGAAAWADTIDQVKIATQSRPVMVEITGTFSYGCDRNPVLLQTTLDDKFIIQIFTAPPPESPAADQCAQQNVPFYLKQEIIPPALEPGDDDVEYKVLVLLYSGTPSVNEVVKLLDRKAVSVEEEQDEAEDPEETDGQEEPEEQKLEVVITPDTIDLKRKGLFFASTIKPPAGFSSSINKQSIVLRLASDTEKTACVPARWVVPDAVTGTLTVLFDNREVVRLVSGHVEALPATVTLAVSGTLKNGSPCAGFDSVRVINSGKREL